jgi:hypothetical protein
MSSLRAMGAALGATLVAGCMLTTSFDGIVGVRPANDGSDGVDAAASDAPITPDSNVDSAPQPKYCSKQAHTFCDDFDEGSVTAAWSEVKNVGGAVALDTQIFVSAPAGARFDVPSGCTLLSNPTVGSGVPKKLHSEADFIVQVMGVAFGNATLVNINVSTNDALQLLLAPDGTLFLTQIYTLADGGVTFQSHTLGVIAQGVWVHMALDATLGGSSSVDLKLQPLNGSDLVFAGATPPLAANRAPSLLIGDCPATGNGGTIVFDNVVLDLQY